MTNEQPTVPQWICTHCFFHLVNGDCTDPDFCDPDDNAQDSTNPLHLFGDMRVTPGMVRDEHSEECPSDYECDCETREFSRSACDGCGSVYHGERHAVTGWIKEGE